MLRLACVAILVFWPCLAIAQDSSAQTDGQQEQAQSADAKKADLKTADLKTAWAEARELLAQAKRIRDPNEQSASLHKAVKQYEACLELKFSDDGEKHRVIREVATAHFELAEAYWPRSAWNVPLGTRKQESSRVTEAREHFSRALELFTQAAEYWRGKVGELPADQEEARKKVIAAGLGFIELGAAESDGAHCRAGIARALPADDAKKKEAVQAAVVDYQRLWKAYPKMALGQYSGLSAAKMLEYTGKFAAAIETNQAVYKALEEGLQAKQSYVEDLHGRVTDQLMSCWNEVKVGEHAKAIEAGEAWLASETSTDGAEVTWEPQIRKRLAMAYYRRWATAGVEKRDDKDRQRALEEATWVADRYPGEVAARFVLRGIAAEERKMKE